MRDAKLYSHCFALVCVLSVDAGFSAAQQVRDSAGIRVVSYERNAAPRQRWTLDPKPTLEIGRGVDEGPQSFSEIMGVVRLSDGRIAVANQSPSEIRLFDPSGRFVRSLGRNGQGPGEFNRILFRLLRSGDTLIGIDNSMRAQIFDPAGELRRSLPRARPPATGSAPARLGFDSSGRAIVQTVERPNETIPSTQLVLVLTRESVDGQRHDEILRIPAHRLLPRRGPSPTFEVYGTRGAVATNGKTICVGTTRVFALICYHGSGSAVAIRREVDGRGITEGDREFFRSAYLAANKGAPPNVIASIEESNRLTQFAARAPVFGRLMLATSGELWVSEFDRTEGTIGTAPFRRSQVPLRWSVFGPDGSWLSDITLPARFQPFEMGADYVIGATLGHDDVDHVTLYRIRR